jgi:hypothetical protein
MPPSPPAPSSRSSACLITSDHQPLSLSLSLHVSFPLSLSDQYYLACQPCDCHANFSGRPRLGTPRLLAPPAAASFTPAGLNAIAAPPPHAMPASHYLCMTHTALYLYLVRTVYHLACLTACNHLTTQQLGLVFHATLFFFILQYTFKVALINFIKERPK